jgi:hypothetical protein
MTKERVCETDIDGDGDDRKLTINIENKKRINIKRKKPTGSFDATDEDGKPLEQFEIKLSVTGNVPKNFPPDEFVMYSKSSPGCGYYYIGGRLVYR